MPFGQDIIENTEGKTIIMEDFNELEINTNAEGGKASEEEQEFEDMTQGHGGEKVQCGTQ